MDEATIYDLIEALDAHTKALYEAKVPRLMSITEVANELHIAPSTVRSWANRKNPDERLPGFKAGKTFHVLADDLRDFLREEGRRQAC